MSDKHLLILGIRGVPASHGGFESFAEQLVPWMVSAGWKVSVYCQGSDTGSRYEDTWQGCRRIHIPVKFSGALATIEFDIKSNFDAIKSSGLLLTLGYNTGFLSACVRIFGRKNLINMDGIEWKRAKYSPIQKFYLWINERLAAWAGTILIADHPEIASHHANHASREKICMIPYGSEKIEAANEVLLSQYGLTSKKFITVIARPEPENSLLEIVSAFSRKPRGVNLIVLGRYDRNNAYQAAVLAAASEEVIFPGALYERSVVQALRFHSLAYVHGHQVGGTNPSLVEALGAGNAIIAHDNKFNRWVAGAAARYFSDMDECDIIITNVISSDEERSKMQRIALSRWEELFTWPKILESYQDLIETTEKILGKRSAKIKDSKT